MAAPFVIFGEGPGPNTDPFRPLYPHATTGAAAKLAALLDLTHEEYLERTVRYNARHDGERPLALDESRVRVARLMGNLLAWDAEARFVFLGGKALAAAPPHARKLLPCQRVGNILFIPPHQRGKPLVQQSGQHSPSGCRHTGSPSGGGRLGYPTPSARRKNAPGGLGGPCRAGRLPAAP